MVAAEYSTRAAGLAKSKANTDRHEFFCHVFCGDGHDKMSAALIVED
jgi:heme/copper-type cytochrome/quinol oxidase subunit 2